MKRRQRHQSKLISTLGAAGFMLVFALPAVAEIASSTPPEPAEYLPANTAYAILLNLREAAWQQLEQYALVQLLQGKDDTLINPGSLPFLPPELDYPTDIAPWVGDTVAIALLPLDRPRATVIAEHEVLIAPIAQPDAFDGFISTVTDRRGEAPETQKYQTLDILYWEPQWFTDRDDAMEESPALLLDDPQPEALPELGVAEEPVPDVPGLAIAVLPDYLIAAKHPAAIRAWVNQRPATATNSLATNPRFLRTLAHPHYDDSLATFYGSLSELVKYSLADFSLPDLPIDIPLPETISPEEVTQLAALQLDSSVESFVYPTPRGIRIQGRGYFDDNLLPALPPLQPAPTVVLNYVPGNSYAVLSGQNLAGLWEQIAATLELSETTSTYLEQARGFFTTFTGLDLDEDLFGWMDRGFSLFLFPTDETPLTLLSQDLHIGLGLALQTSNRDLAEATFAQLDERLGTEFISVESQLLNDQPITGWGLLLDDNDQPDSFLGRGWAGEDTLLLTSSLDSLAQVLTLESSQMLPNGFRFSQSIQDFPNLNQGYLFANTAPMRALFNRYFPPIPEDPTSLELRKLAASVQAFTSTLSFTETYLQLDALVMLAPADGRSLAAPPAP